MYKRFRPEISSSQQQSEEITQLQKLGTSPVLKGEDKTVYDELLNTVWADLRPTDIIERIWVRDIVDDTWEIFRRRRLAMMIVPSMFESATEVSRDPYRGHMSWQKFSEFAQRAQSVDRLITNAVQRRNATLREIERRRFLFAQQLRKSVGRAELQVLEPKLPK
jgi:hypothetical protein